MFTSAAYVFHLLSTSFSSWGAAEDPIKVLLLKANFIVDPPKGTVLFNSPAHIRPVAHLRSEILLFLTIQCIQRGALFVTGSEDRPKHGKDFWCERLTVCFSDSLSPPIIQNHVVERAAHSWAVASFSVVVLQ